VVCTQVALSWTASRASYERLTLRNDLGNAPMAAQE
jgi:hypothetical protein